MLYYLRQTLSFSKHFRFVRNRNIGEHIFTVKVHVLVFFAFLFLSPQGAAVTDTGWKRGFPQQTGTWGGAKILMEWFIVEKPLQSNIRKPFENIIVWYEINQLILRYIWVNRDDAVGDWREDRPEWKFVLCRSVTDFKKKSASNRSGSVRAAAGRKIFFKMFSSCKSAKLLLWHSFIYIFRAAFARLPLWFKFCLHRYFASVLRFSVCISVLSETDTFHFYPDQ